jgi:integrase
VKRRLSDKTAQKMARGQVDRDNLDIGFTYRKATKSDVVTAELRRDSKDPDKKLFEVLGHLPPNTTAELREKAHRRLREHELGEPIVTATNLTPAQTWGERDKVGKPAPGGYIAKLVEDERSLATESTYRCCLARLSTDYTQKPWRNLTPELYKDEHDNIKKEHGEAAALNTAHFVRTLWRFACTKDEGLRTKNPPTTGIRLSLPGGKKTLKLRKSLAPLALPMWWDRVQAIDNPVRREAHIFALATGLRRKSVLVLRWDDVAGTSAWIRAPKGGEVRSFMMPLNGMARECLARVREAAKDITNDRTWAFPGEGKAGHLGVSSIAADNIAAPHALRRTFYGFGRIAGIDTATMNTITGRAAGSGGKDDEQMTEWYATPETTGGADAEASEKIGKAIMAAINFECPDGATDEEEASKAIIVAIRKALRPVAIAA